MAINHELYAADYPYIHSHIYLFQDQVNNTSLDTTPRGTDAFAEPKQRLNRVLGNVKKATANFLGLGGESETIKVTELVQKSIEFSEQIFKNSYVEAATRALRSPEFENALIQKRNYVAKPILNKQQREEIGAELRRKIDPESLVDEDSIVNAFMKAFRFQQKIIKDESKPASEKDTSTKAIVSSLVGFNNDFVKKVANSVTRINKDASLRKKVRKILREEYNKSSSSYVPDFEANVWPAFERQFTKFFLEKGQFVGDNGNTAVSNYLNALKPKFSATFNANQSKFSDISNIRGTEQFLADILTTQVNNESIFEGNIKISMETVGDQNAFEFYKNAAAVQEKNLQDVVTNTFYDPTKNFIADYVITNNGIRARVQSKNYVELVRKWASGSNANFSMKTGISSGDLTWESFKRSVINGQFANEMYRLSAVTSDKINEISYLLANALWFAEAGDISFQTGSAIKRKRTGTGEEGGIAGILRSVDLFVGNLLFGYLGLINYEQINKDEIALVAETNNLFILIGNQLLYPIAAILQAFLDNFDNIVQNVQERTVHAKIGIKGGLGGRTEALNYYQAKEKAVGTFGPATYTNSDLLTFGRRKGQDVLSKTVIESVNINIDMQEILRSSYQFVF